MNPLDELKGTFYRFQVIQIWGLDGNFQNTSRSSCVGAFLKGFLQGNSVDIRGYNPLNITPRIPTEYFCRGSIGLGIIKFLEGKLLLGFNLEEYLHGLLRELLQRSLHPLGNLTEIPTSILPQIYKVISAGIPARISQAFYHEVNREFDKGILSEIPTSVVTLDIALGIITTPNDYTKIPQENRSHKDFFLLEELFRKFLQGTPRGIILYDCFRNSCCDSSGNFLQRFEQKFIKTIPSESVEIPQEITPMPVTKVPQENSSGYF